MVPSMHTSLSISWRKQRIDENMSLEDSVKCKLWFEKAQRMRKSTELQKFEKGQRMRKSTELQKVFKLKSWTRLNFPMVWRRGVIQK